MPLANRPATRVILNRPLKIAVVIPCYRVTASIASVIAVMPDCVTKIYCVDDGCPDQSGLAIKATQTDPRIEVVFNTQNLGVGGAIITGYRKALEDRMEVVVKVDGDGQMDPAEIPRLVAPLENGWADYVKGNRFYDLEHVRSMPPARIVGNAMLSFLVKLSSGYWGLFDPTNGYTAIHHTVLRLLPLQKIAQDYFFESDMLFRLNTVRAVVVDLPMRAIYGDEESHLKIVQIIVKFPLRILRNTLKRIGYNYFLRDFNIASLEILVGLPLLLFGLVFGLRKWIAAVQAGLAASAGTVMLAGLTFLIGVQLLISALNFDVTNTPSIPLQKLLETDRI